MVGNIAVTHISKRSAGNEKRTKLKYKRVGQVENYLPHKVTSGGVANYQHTGKKNVRAKNYS